MVRFEVFKRDSFTCQYCGRKAPDVILNVDHIEPVSKGGTNDILNLITSCRECNSGKASRKLTDKVVFESQRADLEQLQARREQAEMIYEWKKSLMEFKEETVKKLSDHWSQLVPVFRLNANGTSTMRRLVERFNIGEIMDAMSTSCSKYLEIKDGKPTAESAELVLSKLGGVCHVNRQIKEHPNIGVAYYARGILRNRFRKINESQAFDLLSGAVEVGADPEHLKWEAKNARSYFEWVNKMIEIIEDKRASA